MGSFLESIQTRLQMPHQSVPRSRFWSSPKYFVPNVEWGVCAVGSHGDNYRNMGTQNLRKEPEKSADMQVDSPFGVVTRGQAKEPLGIHCPLALWGIRWMVGITIARHDSVSDSLSSPPALQPQGKRQVWSLCSGGGTRYNVCGSSYHLHSPVVWDTVCVSVRWESMTGVSVMEIVPLDFCSFFNNRAPSPQVNLRNCTWFKKSSCCTQEEIDATFGTVKPLPGSTPGCQ
ncbi:hypothetical protein MAR_035467, partial [Mya arenaria]